MIKSSLERAAVVPGARNPVLGVMGARAPARYLAELALSPERGRRKKLHETKSHFVLDLARAADEAPERRPSWAWLPFDAPSRR